MNNNPYESLLEISETIHSGKDLNDVLDRIIDTAMKGLEAERGFILLNTPEKPTEYRPVTARNISRETISEINAHSSSVVKNVLAEKEPVVSVDARTDDRFTGAESVMLQQIKSVICTPLLMDDKVIGAIYMDSRMSSHRFDSESLKFMRAFGRQASIALQHMAEKEELKRENLRLMHERDVSGRFPEIIGKSVRMKQVLELVHTVARSDTTVLIEGESGTGKELVARSIHKNSPRSERPFIPIFCGSLSDSLLESELFGHKKGAFTGAISDKAGLFEEANSGTVFLDEIADISPELQTKLLRVVQNGEVKRVGENQFRQVDVRIISATNKKLSEQVKERKFREDLYYRLNVISVELPPLRLRDGDIELLSRHFFDLFCKKNRKELEGFTPDALKALKQYTWPGNIRELENTIERAVVLCNQKLIDTQHLGLNEDMGRHVPIGQTLKEINKYAIVKTIELTGGNRTRAAEVLGVSRRWLQYQLKDWGMVDGNGD